MFLVFGAMVFLAALLSAGCAKKPAAEVNGDKISQKQFHLVLDQKMRQHAERNVKVDANALKKSVIDELISQQLLLQAAKSKNITVDPRELDERVNAVIKAVGKDAFEKQLSQLKLSQSEFKKLVKDKLLIDRLQTALVPDDSISEREMEDFYKHSPQPFLKPEMVEVRFIQTGTLDEANSIVSRMKKERESFDKMADSLQGNKAYTVSGYGWTQTSYFSPAINSAMKDLKPGSFGGPFQGKDGYYIINLKERKPAGIKSFDEARDEIRAQLLTQKRQAMLTHIIDEMKSKARIKVYIKY